MDAHTPSNQIKLPDGLLQRMSRMSTGSLSIQLFKRGIRNCFLASLKPLNPAAARFAGTAFTMRLIPAREDIDNYENLVPYPSERNLQWKAVDAIGKDEVLVVDSRNDCNAASGGGILLTHMMTKGVAGIVTDGALRDGVEIAAMPFPAYARGINATTRLAGHHVADLQSPIACAGVPVYPGDVLVGDGDGVVVVPRYLAQEVADAAEQQDAMEQWLQQRIADGAPLYGTYPPNEETRAQYEAWRQSQKQDTSSS
ncbi:ribonuclease activity regulator RraA [Paracandidimonas soli]|uniref:Regulator of RNase E activity RraA n=1 Tax=Paracandidimonas soli TaxID=1917182 RepID=A0A4R3UV90_9BURK|nr:ribonuclease activity regulator RraA [Paracandidimonas soli]TCU96065.1 regulator of RNase E activity RraA [Paracandidimonas soli]